MLRRPIRRGIVPRLGLEAVDGLIGHDSVGPRPEAGRIVQPVEPLDDGHPGLLRDVPGDVAAGGQPVRVRPQPLLPAANELLHGRAVAVLCLHHEQVIDRIGAAVRHLRRDIEIAGEILRGLTPVAVPALLGVQIVGRSLTAESVGGDAYDFIPYPEHQVGLSIADAKGKGLPAALLAVAHRAMLHALVSMELRLRATFGRMSDLLARSLPAGNFVTAFYGIVDITERRMVYANAGHLPPLVVRKNGTVELLEVTGAALEFPHVAPISEAYAVFGPGDGLVLFTDGVTQAGPSPEEFFDVSGVEATARTLWTGDAEAVVTGLLDEVVRREGGVLSDDATVVVMKFD